MRRALSFGSFIGLALAIRVASAAEAIVVTTEEVLITDKLLERRLALALKKEGLLTSTRQVNSYMIAVLCEYSEGPMASNPTCSFRRVKSTR
jgi:hypothetical protein